MNKEEILLDALNRFGNFTSVTQEFSEEQLGVIYELIDMVEQRHKVSEDKTRTEPALPIQNVSAMFKTEDECIDYFIKIMPFAIAPTRPAKTKLINPFTSHSAFLKVAEVIGKSVFNLR